MSSNAGKITVWRAEHPGERITECILLDILGLQTLQNANLRGADLWGADLSGADLWGANLWGANLWDANLWGADLRDANLWGADLRGANLRGANLRGANLSGANLRDANLSGADLWGADLSGADLWGGLRIDGSPSHQVTMVPTPAGWQISIGCWRFHTLDDLRDLIEGDKDFPEAEGEERARRIPYLSAILALAEAHAVYHADKLDAVVERWGS